MTLADFIQRVYTVAAASPICGIPVVRRLMPTSLNLRVPLTIDGFVEVFYNEQTGTTAYALIQDGQRVFGEDNTGGWHVHPFDDPACHDLLPDEMSFADFIAAIERHRRS
jgi:hypothetical protein